MIHTARAHARAGLVGNPSDGYFGKTLSILVRDFAVTVRLWDSPHFEILPGGGDLGRYESVGDFLRDAELMGYYGGMRLIKATVKRYHDFCRDEGHDLSDRGNFTIGFESDIPRLVGLSGSSAIVVATLRALVSYYGVEIPKERMPTIALEVETKELNIAAGLQDRVIQVYGGMVYMDFDRELVERTGGGRYENVTPERTPQVYVAYDPDRAEVSDVAHRNLRAAWDAGETDVHDAMAELRELTDRGRRAVETFDMDELHRVTDANFEVRRRIMPIAAENQRMVDVARSVGASAKFAGSGGAIVGVYLDGDQYSKLVDAMSGIRCTCLRPTIFE